jgi:tRNA-dihydrouridine synthase A
VDRELFGDETAPVSRGDVAAALLPYVRDQLATGTSLHHMTRHILGLYQGVPGARRFRRHLSEHAFKPDAGINVLEDAVALVNEPPETLAV